ncbi:hypothetical protein GCM10017744_045550 [Streptomyces antimycoticus]|uniref:Uncharacterized protein n=1 Tax=Streptomyces antimycoticus TaxID=68175 RepID=A0A4D4K9L1_9ACTN|nr:hypothetical protein SANT12839_056860 [Streptomyces antimycoticus]
MPSDTRVTPLYAWVTRAESPVDNSMATRERTSLAPVPPLARRGPRRAKSRPGSGRRHPPRVARTFHGVLFPPTARGSRDQTHKTAGPARLAVSHTARMLGG